MGVQGGPEGFPLLGDASFKPVWSFECFNGFEPSKIGIGSK